MNVSAFGTERRIPWRLIGWGGAATLLAVPWIAGFPWTASDFIVMGMMFAITGGTIELAFRSSTDWAHRLGALAAVLTGFLTVWVNLAAGMIGSEDNPYNLWFGGVLAIAIAGSLLSRSSTAIAGTMILAAAAQAAVSIIGLGTDMRGGIYSLAFAALWLLSAGLFGAAARQSSAHVP
jgi:hypothetical protein